MATFIVYMQPCQKFFNQAMTNFQFLGAERTNTVGPICQVEIRYFMRSCYRHDLNS